MDEIRRESPKQLRFLRCIEQCGSVTLASRWAKVARSVHYQWLENDPTYPARYKAAFRRSASVLADEAVRRGREGFRRAVWHKGKIVGYETVYSDQCLLRMLEAVDPDTYAPRLKQQHTGADDAPLFGVADVRAYMRQAPEDGES